MNNFTLFGDAGLSEDEAILAAMWPLSRIDSTSIGQADNQAGPQPAAALAFEAEPPFEQVEPPPKAFDRLGDADAFPATNAEPEAEKPLPYEFETIADVLTQMFLQDKVADDKIALVFKYVSFFDFVVKKKTGEQICDCESPEKLRKKLGEILAKKSTKTKRPEEIFKFVCKKIMRNLRQIFRNENPRLKKAKKDVVDREFAEKFYAHLKTDGDFEKITAFFPPSRRNKIAKTFTDEFFRKFFASEFLLEKFAEQLENWKNSCEEKSRLIAKKIRKTTRTLLKKFGGAKSAEEAAALFAGQKAVKMFWSQNQNEAALEKVQCKLAQLGFSVRRSG